MFKYDRFVPSRGIIPSKSLHAWIFHGHQTLSQGVVSWLQINFLLCWSLFIIKHVICLFCSQVKGMANPFAYEEYRKEKIRQKIDESRTRRVNIQVGDLGGNVSLLSTLACSGTFQNIFFTLDSNMITTRIFQMQIYYQDNRDHFA